ncbi:MULTISPECIES: fibronectin type III domain-containing protein [Kribbella]|uniref:Fibronectin type-III domain-containing protein n=1 Tax=Kribbella karoonensis TaxID=324851 RepID=A0ABN2ENI8_9ACTN
MTRLARAIRRPVAWWTIAALVLGTFIGYSALGRGAPAVAFQQAGHWVYNATLGAVFRVDGGGKNVDAELRGVHAEAGSQVVQGATNGYVVRSDGVIVFGKSNLTVKNSVRIGIPEEPIGIEAQSGPYLVYRQHGQIVRLGDQLQTVTVGSVVSSAIATADGALWLRDADHFCKLAPAATTLACELPAQGKDAGALLSLAGKPAFANLSKRTLTPLTGDKAGHAVALDVSGALPTASVVAQADVNGRIPILAGQRLLLVDATGAKAAESINLPPGRYDAVATAGASVAVLDTDKRVVRTFAPDGKPLHTHDLGKKKGDRKGGPRVTAGQDGRLYIDDETGQVVTVVDGDGSVSEVDVDGGDKPVSPSATKPTPNPTTPTPSSTPTSTPSTPTPTHRPILPPVQVTIGKPHATETVLPPHPTEHRPKKTETTRPTPPPTTKPTKPTAKPTRKPVPPPAAPGAPGSVTAKPGSGKATVTWTAARANGAAISSYKVSFRVAPGTYVVGLPASGTATVSGSARSHTFSQLLNGGGYIFTVQAINSVGSGPAVDSKVISINGKADPPGPPTKVTAAAKPDGSVTVSWTSPNASDYTMTGYTVIGSDGTKTQVPTYTTTTTLNPAKGKGVSYQVTATNNAGTSVRSAASRTVYPYGPAAAPKVTATPGKGSLTVTWTAPNLNGGQLVHYVVSVTGQADRTVTTTSTRYTGLSAVAVTVSVKAITRERNNSSSATATGTAGSTTATPAAGAPALPPASAPAGAVRRTARRRKDR